MFLNQILFHLLKYQIKSHKMWECNRRNKNSHINNLLKFILILINRIINNLVVGIVMPHKLRNHKDSNPNIKVIHQVEEDILIND